MESVSSLSKIENARINYIFIAGLLLLAGLATAIFGVKGLLFSALAVMGLIVTPFLYDKPKIFLFFALFIYPFTRILPLDDKFIITGSLYIVSFPCTFWVLNKYFGDVSRKCHYLWMMAVYLIIILFNCLRPETGIIDLAKEFGRTFFAIFSILAVYNYIESRPDSLQRLSKYLSYLFNAIAVIAIMQYVTKVGGLMNEGFYRIRGTFFNFNEYAYAITLFICFALYILLTTEKQRLYWIASIGLNLIALMGTFSKTSIINTALIFLIMSMFLPWKRKVQLLTSSVVMGSLLMAFLFTTGTFGALVTRFSNSKSLGWRFQMWERLYNMILQGNIWIGQGVNASKNFLAVLMPRGESFAPHNVYLETTYNFGIIGLIPFVLIFIFILFKGLSVFFDKEITNHNSKIIGVSIIVITVITMIQNFVSNAFYDRAANVIFWVIITLFLCWYKHYKQEEQKK